jgi:methylmalonyl-CoA mutase N-terminal domain/subunit
MLDAMRAEATVGEVCAALRSVFGDYREPAIF